MTLARLEIHSCNLSTKVVNLSKWELDGPSWVLVDWGSGMCGNSISVCSRVVRAATRCSEGMAWCDDLPFRVLDGLCFVLSAEEWLLLIWRELSDIGRWRNKIVPSFGGRTPLRTMIFMTRLQKGRNIFTVDRPAIFPMVWNMWAQMSIWAPLIKSHKNYVLLRLMKLVLDRGYRLKNMISVRVFNSDPNFVVPMEVPMEETSWSAPKMSRISNSWG